MAGSKKVEFTLDAPEAQTVGVAGSFNEWDWQRARLKRTKTGRWRATIALAPGRYEYRFVVDGQWRSDPAAKESVPNPHGGDNSVMVVA